MLVTLAILENLYIYYFKMLTVLPHPSQGLELLRLMKAACPNLN